MYSPSRSPSWPPPASRSSGVGSTIGYVPLPPEGEDATPPPIKLKPRSFNIGTWNINSTTGRNGTTSYPKIPLMEDVFSLANLDLLLITETHCSAEFNTSQKVNVLVNSIQPPDNGRSRAGIALVSRNDGSWTCEFLEEIIPGNAILVKLKHSRSAESFWILGLYGDISDTYVSLESMYMKVSEFLLDYISDLPDWPGCIALGDWNFAAEPSDRSPCRPP